MGTISGGRGVSIVAVMHILPAAPARPTTSSTTIDTRPFPTIIPSKGLAFAQHGRECPDPRDGRDRWLLAAPGAFLVPRRNTGDSCMAARLESFARRGEEWTCQAARNDTSAPARKLLARAA